MAGEVKRALVESLTDRERQVLELLRLGLTNREIGEQLGVSADGAKYHVSEIIGKLGVRNRYEAALWPERPPWLLGMLAPIAQLWRRVSTKLAPGGSGLAALASAVVLIATIALLSAIAVILLAGAGRRDRPPGFAGYVSPDPPTYRSLIFQAGGNANSEVYGVRPDGSGLRNLTNHPAVETGAAWLPDGSGIAISSMRNAGTWTADIPRKDGSTYRGGSAFEGSSDIYVMDADGTIVRNATNTPDESEQLISWSPDGAHALFGYFLDDDREQWVVGADGSERWQVMPNCWLCWVTDWSPDGSRLLGYRDGSVVTMRWDGSDVRRLADLGEDQTRARWSPSGDTIAFTLPEGSESNEAIWLMDADGGNQRRLFGPAPIYAMAWAPDGSALAAGTFDQLLRVDAETGAATLLAAGNNVVEPSWSPDGALIAYSTFVGGDNKEVFVVPATRGTAVNVSGSPWKDGQPRWSPAGDEIIFLSERDSGDGVYQMALDGDSVERLLQAETLGALPEELEALDSLFTDAVGGCHAARVLGPTPTRGPADPGPTCWSPSRALEAKVAWEPVPGRQELQAHLYLRDVAAGLESEVDLGGLTIRDNMPAWSPDSRRLAFYASDRDGWAVFMLDTATRAIMRVPGTETSSGGTFSLAWSPDGAYLFFTKGGGCELGCYPGQLYRVRADGNARPERLTDLRVTKIYGLAP